jgi:hypothetical protein
MLLTIINAYCHFGTLFAFSNRAEVTSSFIQFGFPAKGGTGD